MQSDSGKGVPSSVAASVSPSASGQIQQPMFPVDASRVVQGYVCLQCRFGTDSMTEYQMHMQLHNRVGSGGVGSSGMVGNLPPPSIHEGLSPPSLSGSKHAAYSSAKNEDGATCRGVDLGLAAAFPNFIAFSSSGSSVNANMGKQTTAGAPTGANKKKKAKPKKNNMNKLGIVDRDSFFNSRAMNLPTQVPLNNSIDALGNLADVFAAKDLKSPSNSDRSEKKPLMYHRRQAGDAVEFVCIVCDQAFDSYKKISRHVLIHSDTPRPYKCDRCEKDFANSSRLRRHLMTHDGIKLYACNLCGKSVSRQEHLKRHMLTHSMAKPFHCTRCDFASRRRDTMRSHIRTKHPGEPYHFLCMEDPSLKDDMDAMMAIQNGPFATEDGDGDGAGASHKNDEASGPSQAPAPARPSAPKKSKKSRNQNSQGGASKSHCSANTNNTSAANSASKMQSDYTGGTNTWESSRPQGNCHGEDSRDPKHYKNDDHQKTCLTGGSDSSNGHGNDQSEKPPSQSASGSGSQQRQAPEEQPAGLGQSPVNTQGSPTQPPMGSYPRDMPRLEAVSPYPALAQHAHTGIAGTGDHPPPMYSPYWNMGHGPRGIPMAEDLVRHSLPPLQAFAYHAHPGASRGPSLADVQRFQSQVGTPPCTGDFSAEKSAWNPNRNLLPPRNSVQPSGSNCSENRAVSAQQHQLAPYW